MIIHAQSKYTTDTQSEMVATVCRRNVERKKSVRFVNDLQRFPNNYCKQCASWNED